MDDTELEVYKTTTETMLKALDSLAKYATSQMDREFAAKTALLTRNFINSTLGTTTTNTPEKENESTEEGERFRTTS